MRPTKGMKVPDLLMRRYDQFIALDEAKAILAGMSQHDSAIAAEREFLRQRVEELENELRASEAEAVALIDTVSWHTIAWTAARLHFLLGMKWEATGAKMGISRDAVRKACYLAFSETRKRERRTAGDGEGK